MHRTPGSAAVKRAGKLLALKAGGKKGGAGAHWLLQLRRWNLCQLATRAGENAPYGNRFLS
jgi:hypothetical protein